MGVRYSFSCSCGYSAVAHEGGGFVASAQLRECIDCQEIVGVTVDLREPPVRDISEDQRAKLVASLNRCPRCGGTKHTPARRVGGLLRKRIRCPRCGHGLRQRMTAKTD